MSHEETIFSRFEAGLDFIEFVRQHYPEIMLKWKNKSAVVTSDSSTRPVPEPGDPGGESLIND
jgi:hypothetical protein